MIAVLAAVLALCSGLASVAAADTAGTVHFVRSADSSFDSFTSNPSPEQQAWLRSHMWRMTVWSPYFDEKTSWYGQGWVYKDAYAIYKGSQLASQHPEWILKDAAGNDLYIPFGCAGGSCPQYAGDITNPEFRHYWIEEARAELSHGYRGLFVDDVNMEERVGNGEGQAVTPIDPSNHEALGAAAWRSALAQFMAEVRSAFPSAEIVHNAIWFANNHAGTSDPSIRKEIESANFINLERGVNDAGLTGGSGAWSVNALLSYVDQIHALGRSVILDGAAGEAAPMEYNLASYLLISTGNDAVSAAGQTPGNWWGGWSVNLGEAAGARYSWNGLLRRDFAGGLVLVNPPGEPTRTVTLPSPMKETNGATVSSVTVSAGAGVVLSGAAPSSPSAAPSASPSRVPTQTIVETKPAATPGSSAPGGPTTATSGPGATSSTGSRAPSVSAHAKGKAPGRHRRAARRRRRPAAHARRRYSKRGAPRAVLTKVSGIVVHATRGRVAIEVDRRAGGRWVVVDHLTARVSANGHFLRLLALHSFLHYRVRAIYTGAAGYLPSRSRYRLVLLGAG